MKKLKHNPIPWDFLEPYKGRFFNGQWPTLPEMFDITTQRFGTRPCFEAFSPRHDQYTYNQSRTILLKLANHLSSIGVRKGDRVGLVGKNSPEWAFAYMATLYAGAIIVPVDNALKIEEVSHLMSFAEVKVLFADLDKLDKLEFKTDVIARISLEDYDRPDYILNLQEETSSKIIEKAVDTDVAAILFTSGTTGTPKGVQLTHRNLVADCYCAQAQMNIYATDVFYAILPIHHAYTMLAVFIEAMSVGANIVFGKKLVVSQIFKEMKDGHVTMFLAVPMLYNKLIAALMKGVKDKGPIVNGLIHAMMGISGFMKKAFNINPGKKMFKFLLKKVSLDENRICISGGGPLPASTFKRFNQLGIDFVQGYGLTETSPILTLVPIFDYEEASIGKAVGMVEIKIVDPDADGNGLLYARGPMVMKGYYKNQEATDEIIDKDGWINTGDIGHVDSRGFYYLTGRAKNIIVTEGGKNVFPEEIEDAFQLYDDVDQICVLPFTVDKEKKSEGIAALVKPGDAAVKAYPDPSSLKAHIDGIIEAVNSTLLPYQRIRKTIVIDEDLEVTSTKKVKRFKVLAKYKDKLND